MSDRRLPRPLHVEPVYPGNGLPPRPGEDRPGLSPFGRLAMGQALGLCLLDLEALRELADVIDLDALPVDRLNVALKGTLEASGVQEVDGVRLRFLGLQREVGIITEVEINGVDANVCLAGRHHLGKTHRVCG